MPRIQWDLEDSRVFENGIDRGMLYTSFFPGVAWNGILKVSESPARSDVGEFYLDGQKYLSIPAYEEYSATIEAFSSPAEFASCSGLLELSPGLFATGQVPHSFGFSYRTMIGTGPDYKIHVVYNAVAKQDDPVRETSGSQGGARPYSWIITAIPEAAESIAYPVPGQAVVVPRAKPLSHVVLDTRRFDPLVISRAEDILYGTEIGDPRLVTVQELLGMLDKGVADFSGEPLLKKMTIAGSVLAGKPYKIASAYVASGTIQRQFPVSAATEPGDTLVINCGTPSSTCYPTAATDSKGNVYILDRQFLSPTPTQVVFRSPGSSGGSGGGATAALTTEDTFTITMSDSSNGLVAFAVGLPATLTDGYDVIPASISTGISTTPTASSTPVTDRDIALILFVIASAGGAPAINSPYSDLGYQSGTGTPYIDAGYRILAGGTSGNSQTATATIPVSWVWRGILYLFKRAGS